MGVTTNYSFPYPASTDTPNGASQIQALATAVDTALAAAVATQFVQPLFARKATDEGRASTTTLANDTSLVLTGLVSGAIYDVNCVITYSGGSGASEGDLKWSFTVPAGSTGRYSRTNQTGNSAALVLGQTDSAWTDAPSAATAGVGTPLTLVIKGLLIAGANGSIQFQWAQQSSNSTQSHVLANSYMTARRVA